MAKFASDLVLDASLTAVAQATRMVVLAGQPATYAAAIAGRLVEAPMAPGDFTLANGDVSGRKLSVAPKLALSVAAAGTGDHVALLDVANARLLYVTTCPAQALPAGGTVNIAGWTVEIGDPV